MRRPSLFTRCVSGEHVFCPLSQMPINGADVCDSQENATQLAQQSSRMVDIMSIAETTRRDVQALVKQLNELPRGCGQEWEHDPVVYVDDGLTAPFSVPIRFCHSKTVSSLLALSCLGLGPDT